MNDSTRRGLLAAIGGATTIGGIAGAEKLGYLPKTQTTTEPQEKNNGKTNYSLSINLPIYENSLENAENFNQIGGTNDLEPKHVKNMLEETETVEQEANQLAKLAEKLNPRYTQSLFKEYHTRKQDNQNHALLNQNQYYSTGGSGTINEIYTVKNEELQDQPILHISDLINDETQKQGEKKPRELWAVRHPRYVNSVVVEDTKGVEKRIKDTSDDKSDKYWWSIHMEDTKFTFPGISPQHDEDPPIVYSIEDGMKLYNSKFGDEDIDNLVEATQQIDPEQEYNEIMQMKHESGNWELEPRPKLEMGEINKL